MAYVDGFVIVVKKSKLKAYRKMAEEGKKMWMKYGALEYYECVGDDLNTKKGMGVPFPKLAGAKKNETVIFSWIVYKSKAHRDATNRKVMENMKDFDMKDMPFDMKKFSVGGFKPIVVG